MKGSQGGSIPGLNKFRGLGFDPSMSGGVLSLRFALHAALSQQQSWHNWALSDEPRISILALIWFPCSMF